jgi:hypothetical protein
MWDDSEKLDFILASFLPVIIFFDDPLSPDQALNFWGERLE